MDTLTKELLAALMELTADCCDENGVVRAPSHSAVYQAAAAIAKATAKGK